MFNKKSMFDQFLREFESLFDNQKPTYYKVGPNQVYFTYSLNGDNQTNDELTILNNKLQDAVEKQDFESAVEFRDKIKSIEKNGEKIRELKLKLQESIDKEDFESSIKIRDEIKKLEL